MLPFSGVNGVHRRLISVKSGFESRGKDFFLDK